MAERVLEGEDPKRFLKREMRTLHVKPDPSHHGWFTVPVFYGSHMRVNMFAPKTANPKNELKDRLKLLIRTRSGYRAGDIFKSPWGWFQVNDQGSIDEL